MLNKIVLWNYYFAFAMKKKKLQQVIEDGKFLSKPLIERLRRIGVLDEIGLRNLRIKADFILTRKSITQIEALNRVAEKYFLSPESIRDIVFKQRKKYMIN